MSRKRSFYKKLGPIVQSGRSGLRLFGPCVYAAPCTEGYAYAFRAHGKLATTVTTNSERSSAKGVRSHFVPRAGNSKPQVLASRRRTRKCAMGSSAGPDSTVNRLARLRARRWVSPWSWSCWMTLSTSACSAFGIASPWLVCACPLYRETSS